MKRLLRVFLFNGIGLYLIDFLLPGLVIEGGLETFSVVVLALTVISHLVKPLANLILAPINLLTLGMMGFLLMALSFYFLTFVIVQLRLLPWHFPGFEYSGFMIPAYEVGPVLTAILAALGLSIVHGFFNWLCR